MVINYNSGGVEMGRVIQKPNIAEKRPAYSNREKDGDLEAANPQKPSN